MARRKKPAEPVGESTDTELSTAEMVDAGMLPDDAAPEFEPPELGDEPAAPPPIPEPPEVPTKEDVVALGYSPLTAEKVVEKYEELHQICVDGIKWAASGKNIVSKPALQITSKQSKVYWCIGKPFAPGKPETFLLEELSEENLREIKVKEGVTILVEKTTKEVEVDCDE